tara:strand:+ start:687 stop:1433 length:747 start_codon:yes stop_codon:yes gene_type:complete
MIVSVITVVKNDFKNIEKTINSVFRQNYKRIEYIVIDGNSIDGTFKIIKKNKNKISKILSGVDKNLYQAINKGVKISKGDIIGILHAGDIYANYDTIKKSIEFLKKNRFDFVLSNLEIIDKNQKVYRKVTTSNFFKPFMLCLGIQPPHPTLFIKKKIIKEINYYSTDYKIVGDFDFFCKIFKKKYKWGSLPYTSILQKRGGLSDGDIYSKLETSKKLSKILKDNNFFSLRIFFLMKIFLRIKEMMFKK